MKETAIVTSPIASVFDARGIRADEVFHGGIVEVLQKNRDTCRIRTSYGYEGFVCESHLSIAKGLHIYEKTANSLHRVAHSFADVLDGPDVKARIAATLPRGAEILAGTCVDDFAPVIMADGRDYYMMGAALEKAQTAPVADMRRALVKTAESYVGAGYRWGGRSPAGIDCSGLVFMAYWLNGVIIWRDSKIMPGFAMAKIEFEEADVGDLIFFDGHVAMLANDGKIIHSCQRRGGVCVESVGSAKAHYRKGLHEGILYAGTIF